MLSKLFGGFLIVWASTLVEGSKIRAAPYFLPLDNNPQDIREVIRVSGIKQFILAFVLAPSTGGCIPTWDGNVQQKISEDTKVLKIIASIRSAGGDVSVSFGGYTGMELANPKACSNAQQLAEAYQSVIDKYSLTNIDLDIEGDELGDIDAQHKRFQAIKILKERAKSKGKNLFVSLALPSTTVGLSDLAQDEVTRAANEGIVIDLYKVMAFDFGGNAAEQTDSVKKIMTFAHKQIKQIRADLSDQQVYAATALVLMNGHTDLSTELYQLTDFQKLIRYAQDKNLGRVSFWSLNRDRPCGKLNVEWVSGVCSSIQQEPFDFTKLLSKFVSDSSQTLSTGVPTHQTTAGETSKPTDSPTVVTQSSTIESNATTTPYISTSRVTYSPIIDDVDCRKKRTNSHFPYKSDCHKYIRCYNKLAHLEVCPKGTIFDTKLRICNWPQNVDRPECKGISHLL